MAARAPETGEKVVEVSSRALEVHEVPDLSGISVEGTEVVVKERDRKRHKKDGEAHSRHISL